MLAADHQLRQAPLTSPTPCWLLLSPLHLQGHKTRRAWKKIVKNAAAPTSFVLAPVLDSSPVLILLTSPGKVVPLSHPAEGGHS